MTSSPKKDSTVITGKNQLISYIEDGCKPVPDWRIGTEHEKFLYCGSELKAASYSGECGISAMLSGLQRFGWEPIYEGDNVIALNAPGKGAISLEPGGQFELSGAPLETIHKTCSEVTEHRRQVKEVAEELGMGMLGLGMTPSWRQQDIHWMPKGRYKIMREYMPKVGIYGLDMMTRTCTVQVNLDYDSESDMVKKMRVGIALQPIATALWANSPFSEGKPNGFLSKRADIWQGTDNARTGMMPFAFEAGMGFERYVDYVLDVPMYFIYRDGYLDASGQSFRDFMSGKLPVLPGQLPTLADWEDHLSTVFPEVRLKRFLEMRGADSGPWGRLCALPAFWAGLLYDSQALDACWDLVKGWSTEERDSLFRAVPKQALRATVAGRSVQEIAMEVLEIARSGLSRRAALDSAGNDETGFLIPLQEIAASGMTQADQMLEAYHKEWDGDIKRVYSDYCF
ncbi:MAG: glutamate--cysteine ligase [Rhodospirillaceae bacterium]